VVALVRSLGRQAGFPAAIQSWKRAIRSSAQAPSHPAVTQAGQDRLAQPGDIVRPEVELGDRRAHRTPLLSAVEHWQTELMENRERQLHLRFDANGADDQALAALAGEVLQERRLAHAGLPADDERAALSTTHRAQEFIEPRTLAGTATKHRSQSWGPFVASMEPRHP